MLQHAVHGTACTGAILSEPLRVQVLKDMERAWQKQFDANYARSLDHRSFYFKAIDKKVLGNKHLIAELRAAADAAAARPEAALAVHAAAPAAVRLRPDLHLAFPSKCASCGPGTAATSGVSCFVCVQSCAASTV